MNSMKPLIRPTLFIIMRLGLFLAVLAWIVGQWWFVDASIPTPNGSVCIMVDNRGPVVNKWKFRQDCFLKLEPLQATSSLDSVFNSQEWTDILSYKRHYMIDTYPLVIIRGFNHGAWQGTIIATRHWVVVTFFALFYGGLKWMYGKRASLTVIPKSDLPSRSPR